MSAAAHQASPRAALNRRREPHPVNERETCGADADTAIKRSAFGLKRGAVVIGEDVMITIHVEAYKR